MDGLIKYEDGLHEGVLSFCRISIRQIPIKGREQVRDMVRVRVRVRVRIRDRDRVSIESWRIK